MGKRFLRSLTGTQGKSTLKHIKALAGSLFGHAVEEQFIKVNPRHDVKIPDDAIESEAKKYYTLPEVEDIFSSLVAQVDAQLVITQAYFLGLRHDEIAALSWEDFDEDMVHIRHSVVRGVAGTPETPNQSPRFHCPPRCVSRSNSGVRNAGVQLKAASSSLVTTLRLTCITSLLGSSSHMPTLAEIGVETNTTGTRTLSAHSLDCGPDARSC